MPTDTHPQPEATDVSETALTQGEIDAVNFAQLFDKRHKAKKTKRQSTKQPEFILHTQPVK